MDAKPYRSSLLTVIALACACGSEPAATTTAVTPTSTPAAAGAPITSGCSQTSIGQIPLSDLKGTYQGFGGGLYPGGGNNRPAALETRALTAAQRIVPLNAAGVPSSTGRIGFVSIGHSIASQEFQAFMGMMRGQQFNPAVTVVQGAKSGCASECTAGLQGDGYWTTWVAPAVQSAGLTAAQVQVAWVEETSEIPEYPAKIPPTATQRVQRESDLLLATLQRLKRYLPNVRIAYISAEPYSGYVSVPDRPDIKIEPYVYEEGFAIRDVIGRQDGSTPLLVWGPYQWADGLKPRSDGLFWACSDFGPIGGHLSDQGSAKVAQLLMNFLRDDTAANVWLALR
jgi:hypothetical protein